MTSFSADIDSLVNIDLLPADEIEAAGVELNRKMRDSIQALKKLASDYGKIAIAQPAKELEPVLVERQSPAQAKAEISRTGSRSDASVARTRLNKQTYVGEVGEVGDMIAQAVTVSQKDIDAAIAESRRLADQFKDVYALFKRFVKEGDLDKVERLRADIETYAVDAQASIDSAIAKAKTLDTPDNSLVNSLGGQKGQIGRKANLAQQQAIKLRRQQESAKAVEGDGEESLKSVEDIAENVRDYLAKLQQSVGKRLDPDEFSNAESAAYNAAGKFGQNQIKFEKAENQINNRANSAEVALAGSLGKVGSGSETLGDRVNRIFKAENVPEKAQAAIGGLIGQITKYTGALTALGLFTVGFTAFKAIAGQATAAAVEINNAERKLKLALGSLDAAQQKISDIRARANELGTNASQDIAGETRLQIAARGTSLSGNNASSIGEALQSASAVYGLNAQEQEQAYRALEQSISKGKISAEELRGQLGEVLPGAFATAARAIGVTTSELDRMLAAGEVMSSNLLPKLAQQMKAENFEGMADAAATYTAAVNRVSNESDRLQQTIGQSLIPAQTIGLNAYAKALSFAADNAGVLATAFGLISAAATGLFLKALVPVLASTQLGVVLMGTVQAVLAGVAASLAPVALAVAAIAAVLAVGYVAFDVFGNSAGQSGKNAKNSAKNLEQLQKELDSVKDAANGAAGALDTVNRGLDDNTGLRARGITNRFRNIPLLGRLTERKITGQRTGAIESVNEINQDARDVVQTARDASGTAQFQEYRRIQAELDQTRQRREAIQLVNPEDLKAVKELTDLEASLTEQQQQLAAVVNKPIAALDVGLRLLESQLDELERAYDSKEIGYDEYIDGTEELKARIEEITQEQERFNDTLSQGNRQYQDIIRRAEQAAAAVADLSQVSEMNSTIRRTELNGQDGLSDADRSYREALITRAETEEKLAVNAQAIAALEAELQSREITSVTSGLGLGTLGENVGSAEIQRLLSDTEDPGLTAALTLMQNLKELQSSSATLAENQSKIIRDLQKQIEETDKSIEDYYKKLEDEINQLELDLDSSKNQSAFAKIKSDIIHAIDDTGDNLLSGLGDLIVSQVEAVNQAVLAKLELEQGKAAANARRTASLADIAGIQAGILQPGQFGAIAGGGSGGSIAVGGGGALQTHRTGTLAAQEYGASRGGGSRRHAGQDIDLGPDDSFQSYIGGTVTRVGNDPGGYGHYIDVFNESLGVVERIAELDRLVVGVGDRLESGSTVGAGTHDTGVVHYEIRTDVNGQGQGGYGYNGTVNSIEYLEQLGIVNRNGQSITPSNRSSRASHDHGPAAPSRPTTAAATGSAEANLIRFFDAISYLEANNDPTNYNKDRNGNVYASGAFQFTPITRTDASQLGLQDPGDRSLSYEEQRSRAIAFARRRDPRGVAAAEAGDYREAERQLRERWTSLPGAAEATQGEERYQEYYRILGGASSPVGGGMSSA